MASKNKSSDEKSLIDEIKERVAVIQEKEAAADDSSENFEPSGFEPSESVEQEQKLPILDSLKEFYKNLEDKWYETLDALDEKFPVYKIIDTIEKFVPSFPLFLGIVFLAVLLGLWVLFSVFVGPGLFGANYSFRVVGEDTAPIEFANIIVSSGGKDFNAQSDEFGEFRLNLPSPNVKIVAQKEGYLDFETEIMIEAGGFNEIVLKKAPPAFTKKTIQPFDENGRIFSGNGTITFTCSNPSTTPPKPMTVSNGIISDISVPENCGTLSYRFSADGYDDCEGQATGTSTNCYLSRREQPKGAIEVHVSDADTSEPLLDIPLTLYKKSNDSQVKSKKTVAGGIALFDEIMPGTYYLSATQLAGYKDVSESSPITVEANQTTKFGLELKKFTGEAKKIFGKLVDKQSGQPVKDATIELIVGLHINQMKYSSDEDGLFEITNLQGDSYGLRISHPDYLTTSSASIKTVSVDETKPTVIELEKATAANSGTIQVVVTDSADRAVEGAHVVLKSKALAAPFEGKTNAQGELLFSNMPPGDYNAAADIDGAKGESQAKHLAAGTTLTLEIKLVTAKGRLKVIVKSKQAPQNPIPNASVQIINQSNGIMLQEQTTGETGETPEISLQVGQAVVAQVQKLDGYCTPFTSAPVTIQENVTNQITILLEPGNCSFSITFDKDNGVFNYSNGQAATGTLQAPSKYRLKFTVSIPQDVANAKIVVKTGEHAKASDDPLNIFGTNVPDTSWVGAYSDDCNPSATDVYADCGISVNVSPISGVAKKVVLTVPAMKAGTHEFSANVNTGSIQTATQDVKVFFGAKAQNKSDGAIMIDPTTGLHEQVLTIGGALACSGAGCPKFDITTDLHIMNADGSLGTVVSGQGICEPNVPCVPFEVAKNSGYQLNVWVKNLTSQAINNLSLKVSGPTQGGNPYIKLNNSGATVTSAAFALADKTDAANSVHEETLNITPLIKAIANDGSNTGGTFLELSLVGRAEPEADKKRWFNINDEIPPAQTEFFKIGVDPQDLTESLSGQSVTVTALKESDGNPLQNVSVVMQQIDSGSPDFVAGVSPPKSTDKDGMAVFSGITTRAAGAHVCFQATFQNANAQVACVNVISEAIGTFSPTNIDCVSVSPSAITFNEIANASGTKTQDFTVTTTKCDGKIKLKFSKIDATSSIKVLDGARETSILGAGAAESEWGGMLGADGDSHTFKVDISNAKCLKPSEAKVDCTSSPATCLSENTICPGEYRVNVFARFDTQATNLWSNATNGKIRVYALPGTAAQGYCFNLCTNGKDCTFDPATNPGATFNLNSSPIEGKAANICALPQISGDSSLPKIDLSTCPTGEACAAIKPRTAPADIPFEIQNYSLEKTRGALANVSDFVNTTGAQQANELQVEVLLESSGNTGLLNSFCDRINSSYPQTNRELDLGIWTMEYPRTDGSCTNANNVTKWVDNYVGFPAWGNTNLFSDYTVNCNSNIRLPDGTMMPYCADSTPEAWGPGILYLLKQGVQWKANAKKVIIVASGAFKDPTGAVQDIPGHYNWPSFRADISDPTYPISDPQEFPLGHKGFGSDSEYAVIQKISAAVKEKERQVGPIEIWFAGYSYWGYSEIFWPGGLDQKSDILEAMEDIAQATNGKVNFANNPFPTIDELKSASNAAKTDVQPFHVIFEGKDGVGEGACFGHDGLEGTTGAAALESLRRDFDWRWKSMVPELAAKKLDFCNPQGFDSGEPNGNFVYCDAVQFQQEVLERILAIQKEYKLPLAQQSAVNLGRLEKFSAALIVDGYGADFLQDFSALKNSTGAFGSSPQGIFENDFDYDKYVVDGNFKYKIGYTPGLDTTKFWFNCTNSSTNSCNANNVLPFSGIYDVKIAIKFAAGSIGTFLNGANLDPAADITVNLTLKKPLNSKNLLYFLPFDGSLGETGGKFERINYGVDYTGDVVNLFTGIDPNPEPFATLPKSDSSSALVKINVTNDAKPGNEKQLFQLLNAGPTAAGRTRGVVFRIACPTGTSNCLTNTGADKIFDLFYTPAVATPVLMQLTKDTLKNATAVEGFYALKISNTAYADQASFGNELGASWSGIASNTGTNSCRDFKGDALFKNQMAPSKGLQANSTCALAQGISAAQAFGFVSALSDYSSNGQSVFFESTVFSPSNLVFQYQLSAACSNGQATFYTMNDSTTPTKASVNLTAASGLPSYPQTHVNSVADMIDGVKSAPDGKEPVFCVYNSSDSMEIWFNENSLRNRLVAEMQKPGKPLEGINMCYGD